MSLDLATVAARGGLVARRRGLGPCPVCGAETRGRHDRRAPISLYVRDGAERWHCLGCGAGGGAAALLAALRYREIPPRGDPRWAEVMAEAGDRPARGRSPPRPAPVPRVVVARTPSPPPVPLALGWPPPDEVAALWAACRPVAHLDPGDPVHTYLHTRGIDTTRLSLLDLTRSLLPGTPLRRWVPKGGVDTRAWTGVYRLVTPMVDPAGRIRSLRFRAIGEAPAGKKALNPRGYGYAGLVMADPMGQALLRGERADEGVTWDGRVVVVEGEPDFWTWACHPGRFGRPATFAVLGVVSGSWTDEVAGRIPSSARVIVRTHHDPPGHAYAERIRASLASRCPVLRSTPPPSPPGPPDVPPEAP